MLNLLLVGSGGFCGAALRYLINLAVQHHYQGRFPLSTFAINLTAAVLMGFLSAILASKVQIHPRLLLLMTTGFLGGFSTLSALSLETIDLIEHGQPLLGFGYAFGTLALCLVGILFGRFLASFVPAF